MLLFKPDMYKKSWWDMVTKPKGRFKTYRYLLEFLIHIYIRGLNKSYRIFMICSLCSGSAVIVRIILFLTKSFEF